MAVNRNRQQGETDQAYEERIAREEQAEREHANSNEQGETGRQEQRRENAEQEQQGRTSAAPTDKGGVDSSEQPTREGLEQPGDADRGRATAGSTVTERASGHNRVAVGEVDQRIVQPDRTADKDALKEVQGRGDMLGGNQQAPGQGYADRHPSMSKGPSAIKEENR